MVFVLHLLYQEIKLYELMREERSQLARILLDVCVRLNRREYGSRPSIRFTRPQWLCSR